MAICAGTNASLPEGNESASIEQLVLIVPSHFQASAEEILNISYIVVNKYDCTLMNVSLETEENGPVLLNKSILLPLQASGGIESILLNDSDFSHHVIRKVEVSARNPDGEMITKENSTSIELLPWM